MEIWDPIGEKRFISASVELIIENRLSYSLISFLDEEGGVKFRSIDFGVPGMDSGFRGSLHELFLNLISNIFSGNTCYMTVA